MTIYFDKLKEVKTFSQIDYFNINMGDAKIMLQPVDESDETINLLTKK